MRTILRNRPSPALIVAVIALFTALAGTSYAVSGLSKNAVGSKQLKKGAVKTPDLSKNAVTTGKVKNGSLTDEDFAAKQLPSSTVTTRVVTASAPVTGANAGTDVTAPCQAGERAVGGGGLINNDDNEVTYQASHPAPGTNGSTPTGWTVRFQVTGIPHTVTVYAVCATS